MKKLIAIGASLTLLTVFLFQAQSVLAGHENEQKPLTSPVTSPSECKPGWGFGDKNHCHIHQFHEAPQNIHNGHNK